MKIGIIGLGKMGETIAVGLKASSKSKTFSVMATIRNANPCGAISKRLGIQCHTDNRRLVTDSEIVIICVRPNQVQKTLEPISDLLTEKHTLISVAATVTTGELRKWAGPRPSIVRSMPNTPCCVGEGMTLVCTDAPDDVSHLNKACEIFNMIGKTAVIDEGLMDGATGLSGSGPAFIFLIIEALSEAGVKVGLSRRISTFLVAQTMLGSAKMVLERDIHPAALKDEVTTPAGLTIEGILALEEGHIRSTLINAVLAVTKKSKEMKG